MQLAQPAHVALAPRGDAPVQPVRLGLEPLVQPRYLGLLGGQDLLAPGLETGIALVAGVQGAAVEPPGLGRQPGQEAAVVADHRRTSPGRRPAVPRATRSSAGRDGWWARRAAARRARSPGRPPARRGGSRRRKGRLARGRRPCPAPPAPSRPDSALPRRARPPAGRPARSRPGSRPQGASAPGAGRPRSMRGCVSCSPLSRSTMPGQDPQQGRLAGAVAADEADPVALGQHRVQPVEQLLLADPQAGVVRARAGVGPCPGNRRRVGVSGTAAHARPRRA